jgi:phosphoglycerol transferase MdoB-like AlkP superfamily enzyme
MDAQKSTARWHEFFQIFQRIFGLWLLIVLTQIAFRGIFLLSFHDRIGDFSSFDLLQSFRIGLCFDGLIGCYWITPALIAAALGMLFEPLLRLANRLVKITGWAYAAIFTFFFCVTLGFFREFDDLFNHDFFRFFEDQMWVVFQTVYKEYHLIPLLGLSATVGAIFLLTHRFAFSFRPISLSRSKRWFFNHPRRIAVTAMIAIFFVLMVRGSVSSQPLSRKHAAITGNRLLNKSALNPFAAFYYAVGDELETANDDKVLEQLLAGQSIRQACDLAFEGKPAQDSITDYITHKASGPKGRVPQHIFYIFAESFDLWALQDEYRDLHLADNTKRLAREGILFDKFYSVSNCSYQSLMVMNTGLPCTSRQIGNATRPFPTSLPHTLGQLGYDSRFFYGGNLSWYRIDEATIAQGFKQSYGAGNMGRENRHNERGVTDETLFDFVLKTVPTDKPSYTYIMTSTFHPPYDLDVYGMGYPTREIPASLKDKFEKDPKKLLPMLGHRWYADRALGQFIAKAEKQYPDALFVICGDHFSRRFINNRPTPHEESALVGILYGKSVLEGIKRPEKIIGTHFDVVPTILELTAPKGFEYLSFGRDLLSPSEVAHSYNADFIGGDGYVFDMKHTGRIVPTPGEKILAVPPTPENLLRKRNSLYAAALWLVSQDEKLPPITKTASAAENRTTGR